MNKNYSSYTHNGIEVPRVSDIIKLLAKDSLLLWSNYLGFKRKNYKDVLEAEANIGTMIHDFIDEYDDLTMIDKFDFYKFGIFNEADKFKVINGIVSYKKLLNKIKNKYKVVEHDITLTNEHMGGTLDAVIESPFNKNHVIISDYKTSGDFYITHFLQLVGYLDLYRHNRPDVIVDGVMVVLVDKKNGDMARTRFYSVDQLEPFVNIFINLLKVKQNMILAEQVQYNSDIFR